MRRRCLFCEYGGDTISCEYCHTLPHRSGCPAERDGREIRICDFCGRTIEEGEFFIETDGLYYHDVCAFGGGEDEEI